MVLWCISVELLCLHLLFWKIPSSAGVRCSPFGHKDSSLYAATEMVKIENVQDIYSYMMKSQNACQHVSFPLIGCMELCFYSHQMGRIPQCAHSSVFPKTGLITVLTAPNLLAKPPSFLEPKFGKTIFKPHFRYTMCGQLLCSNVSDMIFFLTFFKGK